MGIFMYLNAGEQSFWFDEIASLGFISSEKTFGDFLYNYITIEIYNLPLYQCFLFFLYRLLPFGEQNLLLLSILFTLIGIIVMAKCADELAGSYASFFTIGLSLVSTLLIWQCGWELRSYSLLLCLSATVLLFYIKKNRSENRKYNIYYAFFLVLLLYTHWFGVLVAAFYGCMDAIKWIVKRKVPLADLFSYIGCGVLFLPWLVLIFVNRRIEPSEFWATPPHWKDAIWVMEYLLSGNRIFFLLFLIGCLVAIIQYKKNMIMAQLFIIIVGIISSIFIYSSLINPQGSLFVSRYFIVLVPHMFILTSFSMSWILQRVRQIHMNQKIFAKLNLHKSMLVLLLIFFIYLGVNCYNDSYKFIRKPNEPYREAAELMVADRDFYKEDSLLIGRTESCALNGFIDYYFGAKGYMLPPNIINGGIDDNVVATLYHNYNNYSEEDLLQYNKLYCLQLHMSMDTKFAEFVAEHYQLVADYQALNLQVWEK
ncbi:MAG: hypothetical protein LBV33_01945 [Lachnospiraceae bacterium]|jgi:hypothetical protein|nr:hypothetical protein [Lachnospiraceae bacterium]